MMKLYVVEFFMNPQQADLILLMQLLGEPLIFLCFWFVFHFELKQINMVKFLFFCRAYDRAAIKFRGSEADINFSIEDYEEDLQQVLF